LSSPLVDKAVAVMEKHTGTRPGCRRARPRGPVCSATFARLPELRALDRAEHFQGGMTPAQVRPSNGPGSQRRRAHETRDGAAPADMGR
jgi:hypothetical protein